MLKKILHALFFLSFVLIFPSKTFADCDHINSLTITPTSGTTKTSFTIKGSMSNCTGDEVSLKAFNEINDNILSLPPGPSVDDNDNFVVQNVIFPTATTWTINVFSNATGAPNGKIPPMDQLHVSVTDGGAYNCGDVVPNGGAKCPDNCKAQQVNLIGQQYWSCGGDPSAGHIQCPVCPAPFSWDGSQCAVPNFSNPPTPFPGNMAYCAEGTICTKGVGCSDPLPTVAPIVAFNPCPDQQPTPLPIKGAPTPPPVPCKSISTGLGFSIPTDAPGFAAAVLGLLLVVGGVIMLLVIIITGYRLMFSQGDPEKVKAAREQLTGAVIGLLFMIFSVAILAFIGINILHIPQFTR